MTTSTKKSDEPFFKRLLLASERTYSDGKFYLQLVAPNSSYSARMEEKWLNESKGIKLGDFLYCEAILTGSTVRNFEKTTHNAELKTTVERDEAFVEGIRAKLIDVGGTKVFQNTLFPNAICDMKDLAPGRYTIRVNSKRVPKRLPDGKVTYFEGSNPVLIELAKPPRSETSIDRSSPAPIFGAGFSQKAAAKVEELVKLKAVVLTVSEANGYRTHYLWILDKLGEGRFSNKVDKLSEGHVFEGEFKKEKNGKWTCQKYTKAVQNLLDGGLDAKDRVFFNVKIENFQKAGGNRKYSSAHIKYFGEVFDVDSKLPANCNRKIAKIQRRRADKDKEFVWMFIE